MMLSRVAERVYWLARYLERVENTARLTYVHTALLMDLPDTLNVSWFTLISIFDAEDAYFAQYDEVNEYDVMQFLLADRHYGSSLINTLAAVRENARTSLDILPESLWEHINELHLLVKGELPSISNRRRRQKLLLTIAEKSQIIWGIVSNHMSRNPAYDFLQVGKHLERADMTSRILELSSMLVSDNRNAVLQQYERNLWATVLTAISAQQMYIQTYHMSFKADKVLTFLIKNGTFPRSLYFSMNAVGNYLNYLPKPEGILETQQQIMEMLSAYDPTNQTADEVSQMMDSLQIQFTQLSRQISQTWFYPDYSVA